MTLPAEEETTTIAAETPAEPENQTATVAIPTAAEIGLLD